MGNRDLTPLSDVVNKAIKGKEKLVDKINNDSQVKVPESEFTTDTCPVLYRHYVDKHGPKINPLLAQIRVLPNSVVCEYRSSSALDEFTTYCKLGDYCSYQIFLNKKK